MVGDSSVDRSAGRPGRGVTTQMTVSSSTAHNPKRCGDGWPGSGSADSGESLLTAAAARSFYNTPTAGTQCFHCRSPSPGRTVPLSDSLKNRSRGRETPRTLSRTFPNSRSRMPPRVRNGRPSCISTCAPLLCLVLIASSAHSPIGRLSH